jgi:hypothetical protein
MLANDMSDEIDLRYVTLKKNWTPTCNFCDAIDNISTAVREVVNNDNFMSLLNKHHSDVAANVAATARQHYVHIDSPQKAKLPKRLSQKLLPKTRSMKAIEPRITKL